MPRVGAEEQLRTLTECRYSHPAETLLDLQRVQSQFSDLRLHVDFYCFPNKNKKKLVYLTGTVPVQYEGSDYNIPVCIWLHETHPVSRPRCYVSPSVSMVINPSCPCVDAAGNISLDGLKNWTQGVSTLSLLVSEMRQAFQKDTPLYAKYPVQAPPMAGVQVSQLAAGGSSHPPSFSSVTSPHLSAESSQEKARRSYTDELLGIDFSTPSSSKHNNPFLSSCSSAADPDPLSRRMEALRVNRGSSGDRQGDQPAEVIPSETHKDTHALAQLQQELHTQTPQSGPAAGPDYTEMAAHLAPNQGAMFWSLMRLEGRSFSPWDVMEAVQLNRDFASALRFLTHSCPICQDQVTFSKIITMTHCSCFLCQTCFKTFFSAAIKERSIDQLVCPQCCRPEIRGQGGMEESMDYFNLLDTQIRHFLPPQIHELFQRKLRDRALQEMPNFCWCAHCSFGMLHEAGQLRMDCPSCKKSTCSQCRSPWSPQHQGLTCQQYRVWQQQNQPDQLSTELSHDIIECPNCQSVFSLSKGGCLHFTCSQCQHQFCGGCSQAFILGAACGFSSDCGTKGLHAHHPRDCLYHLRDWSVSRLQLLLQYYRVSPSWLDSASDDSPETSRTVCLVLELRDDGVRHEEPCGRPALPEYKGYCQLHYKEQLVELINRCRADPAVLFGLPEMMAELRRWCVAVPSREPGEAEPTYVQRLLLTLTNSVPLRKQRLAPLRPNQDLCLWSSAMAAGAPHSLLLLTD